MFLVYFCSLRFNLIFVVPAGWPNCFTTNLSTVRRSGEPEAQFLSMDLFFGKWEWPYKKMSFLRNICTSVSHQTQCCNLIPADVGYWNDSDSSYLKHGGDEPLWGGEQIKKRYFTSFGVLIRTPHITHCGCVRMYVSGCHTSTHTKTRSKKRVAEGR